MNENLSKAEVTNLLDAIAPPESDPADCGVDYHGLGDWRPAWRQRVDYQPQSKKHRAYTADDRRAFKKRVAKRRARKGYK